jgi:hypothetical protein
MKIQTIDDWMPIELASLYSAYVCSIPHTLTEYSGMDDKGNDFSLRHLSHELDVKMFFNEFLRSKIIEQISSIVKVDSKELENMNYRFHTNMHFPEVGGKSFHSDNTEFTAILNLTDTDGSFVYIDDEKNQQTIPDKFNRMIIFSEPNMPHKAIPPSSNNNGPRVTVAFKLYK